jgi:hypothetical protein
LESEGITFLENGCIDLKKHLWDSSQQWEEPFPLILIL